MRKSTIFKNSKSVKVPLPPSSPFPPKAYEYHLKKTSYVCIYINFLTIKFICNIRNRKTYKREKFGTKERICFFRSLICRSKLKNKRWTIFKF